MSKRICAWCGKILGEATTEEDTHGMCPKCLKKELAKLDEKENNGESDEEGG